MAINLLKRDNDLFAEYKLNVLHLYLTDDQGWRIKTIDDVNVYNDLS